MSQAKATDRSIEGALNGVTVSGAWLRKLREEPFAQLLTLYETMTQRVRIGAGNLSTKIGEVCVEKTTKDLDVLVRKVELHGASRMYGVLVRGPRRPGTGSIEQHPRR